MTETGAPQNGPEYPGEVPGFGRSPGQVENPELSAKLAAKRQEKAQIQAESLSIAQRLTRRAKVETIKIPFKDDLGEFFIEVRLPTTAEMEDLLAFNRQVSDKQNDPAALELANDRLCEKLADLAVDPSLDAEFFKGGSFLASDLSQIIKEIMLEEERRIKSVSSFRENTVRHGSL